MGQIESKFMYEGDAYTLELNTKGIKIFVKEEGSDIVIITDKDDEIISTITADCAQNMGFLKVI